MRTKNQTPVQIIADCLGAETQDGIECGVDRLMQFPGVTPEKLAPFLERAAVLKRDCANISKAMPMRSHTYRANRDIVLRELAAELAAELGIPNTP